MHHHYLLQRQIRLSSCIHPSWTAALPRLRQIFHAEKEEEERGFGGGMSKAQPTISRWTQRVGWTMLLPFFNCELRKVASRRVAFSTPSFLHRCSLLRFVVAGAEWTYVIQNWYQASWCKFKLKRLVETVLGQCPCSQGGRFGVKDLCLLLYILQQAGMSYKQSHCCPGLKNGLSPSIHMREDIFTARPLQNVTALIHHSSKRRLRIGCNRLFCQVHKGLMAC